MKKMILSLIAMVTMTISAQAMTFSQAQQEALFLSDKMAYELNLSNQQYEAVYEINLDYLTALTVNDDIFGIYWERRNEDLSYVLSPYQYREYIRLEYFYRPVYWQSGFVFRIYTHYTDRHHFYYSHPRHYTTYRGAHNWHSNGNKSYYKGRTFDRDRNPRVYNHSSVVNRQGRYWHSNSNVNRKSTTVINNTTVVNNRNTNVNRNYNSTVNRNNNTQHRDRNTSTNRKSDNRPARRFGHN